MTEEAAPITAAELEKAKTQKLADFYRSLKTISGKANRTVVNPGGQVPETVLPTLVRHPAVRAVSPFSSTYVQTADEETPFLLVNAQQGLDSLPQVHRLIQAVAVEHDTAQIVPGNPLLHQFDELPLAASRVAAGHGYGRGARHPAQPAHQHR